MALEFLVKHLVEFAQLALGFSASGDPGYFK